MKQNRIGLGLRITAYVCIALFALCTLIYGFKTGFGLLDLLKKTDSVPDTAYTYEEEVKALREIDVQWVNGPVTVKPYAGDVVKVTETAEKALQEDEKLYLEISGGKLSVKWNSALLQLGLQRQKEKHLEVLVPQVFYDALEDMRIETVSGDIEMENLTVRKAVFASASGELHLKDLTVEELTAETVSGHILCQNIAAAEKLEVASVSGSVTAAGISAGACMLDTTSGDAALSGAMQTLKWETVSGGMQMDLSAWPEKTEVYSVSGETEILAPATEEGFLCRFTGVSGDLESDFALKKSGDTYTCGKGTYSVRIDTTSGDVSLNQKVG